MSDAGTSTLIEVLTATGLLTAVSETLRWWFGGRGRQKIDQAKVVQGMAIDLLTPLHAELDTAQARLRDLNAELESVLGWAIIARALLDAHKVEYPPPPEPVFRKRG